MMEQQTLFERNPNITIVVILTILCLSFYGIFSFKINDQSIKKNLQQFFVGKVIQNNIGRYINLREYPPNATILERPTWELLSHIAPNTIERKYYSIHTDQNGFIGPTEIHSNPDLKIFFLGGSTTECLYMDEENRFPFLAGRLLEKGLKKKINSFNVGKSANETQHSINNLLNKILPLEPDVVILMHNINDLVMLRLQGTYGYVDSKLSHIQSYKTLFSKNDYPIKYNTTDNQKIKKLFENNLKTFVSICKIRGIKPVLMTQANRVFNDPLYHEFNDIIRIVASHENILLIDLAKSIPQTPDLIYDAYHYTEEGSILAAKVISKDLEKYLIN